MQEVSQFNFCLQLQQMLQSRQITGRTGVTFDGLPALSTTNNLILMRQLALEAKVRNTLEIGLSFGGSCLTLAATHRDLGNAPNYQHTAIDPFQSTVWDDTARVALEKADLQEYVDIFEGFSYAILPKLLAKGQKFDLVYIDGSHLFEDVFIDFFHSNKLLNQRGLILFDDSSDANIRKVLNFIDSNLREYYQKVDLSKYAIGSKRLKSIAANLLKRNQLTVYRKVTEAESPWDSEFKKF